MSDLQSWKKPLLTVLCLLGGALLISALCVRLSGWVFAPLLGEYAAAFRQLFHAHIGWSFWLLPGVPAAIMLLKVTRTHAAMVTLMAVLMLAAAFLCMRVNTVPLPMAVQIAVELL